MNAMEKLAELLNEVQETGVNEIPAGFGCTREYIANEKVASHLTANGVTVQELDGCEHCRNASYTENPFIVITQMGREVKTKFNFCPNCGRRLPHPPEEND